MQRHSLVDLGEPVKQLFESYNISHDFEQLQVSETCSHAPEDGTPSSDDEVHSSSSVAGTEKSEPEVLNKDATETCQVTEPTKETSSVAGTEILEPEVLNKDAIETCQVAEPTKETSSRKEIATKNRRSVNKIATTPKSTEVSGTIKKKLENPKQKPNKGKRQGKKSAGVEGKCLFVPFLVKVLLFILVRYRGLLTFFIIGPANAGTAKTVLPEDKENMVRRDNMA